MKCYLINLDRSKDRYRWFVGNTEDIDFDVIRVSAVDGYGLEYSKIEELLANQRSDYPMPSGALGCFLSHRKAWSRIVATDDRWAFIAEDDAHISKSAKHLFKNENWIPDYVDIVKAETSRESIEVSAKTICATERFKLRELKSAHRNTAGYFIAKKTAERLLKLTEDYCDPIDEVLFNPELGLSTQLRILQLDPAFTVQDKISNDPFGMEPTIIREADNRPKVRMSFGPAKLIRETKRFYRKKVRPRIMTMTRQSVFGSIPYADD